MRFTISRSDFMEAINVVSRGRSGRSTLPILSGIYIQATDSEIILQATDLEISVHYSTQANIEETGETVIPGKLISEIVKKLPDAAVSCVFKDEIFTVECMNSSFNLKTMDPKDFPAFPEIQLIDSIDLPIAKISTAVSKVSKAVSKDESHLILTGINMTANENNLTMAATDSYRLAITEMEIENHQGQFNLIIPGKTFDDICKLASHEETITIGYSDNQIYFVFGSSKIVTRKLEGNYPNYKQIIPSEKKVSATVDTKSLIDAVNRISIMAQEYMQIRMMISPDLQQISISSKVADVGGAEETIDAQIDGEELFIGFNYQYLKDGLSSIDSEEVVIEANEPLKPGVFKALGDDNFFYLSMPVKITS